MRRQQPVPLVSVIIAFWNEERFLGQAISSVLSQTYSCLELLLVDDGSSDGSVDVVSSLDCLDNHNVRLLSHPRGANKGVAASRAVGVAVARGDLIAFLDGDDYWEPDHLAGEVAVLARHPEADAVCGMAVRWASWDGRGLDTWFGMPFANDTVIRPPDMLVAVLRDGRYTTPTCNLLVRERALRRIGDLGNDFQIYEDQVMLAKLYLGCIIAISCAKTARYRQHEVSATSRAESTGRYHPQRPNLARWEYLQWLKRYVAITSGDKTELMAALSDALRPYRGWKRVAVRADYWARRNTPATAQRCAGRLVRLLRRNV